MSLKNEYDKYVVAESRNIARSGTGKDGKIDFRKPREPLLFIAGEKDHIIPCFTPAYPYHAGEPEILRKNIDSNLRVSHFGRWLGALPISFDTLPEKPILIGHSMGAWLCKS